MEIVIEYVHTAFKHHCTKEDIRHAITNWLYDDLWDDSTDKYLLIGFDRSGNPLEIMYNVVDEQKLRVFHAMPCRNTYLPFIDRRKNNA
ncbi:hypothetical protein LQZ19_15700 [Treponema primitia]|uniref:hypothetical protein n=1 Tax=Treponema primitia TaxID=88058 RepID=UPI0039800A2F